MSFWTTERYATLRTLIPNGQLVLRVNGDCMLPVLRSGVQSEVTAGRFYWPGDVLVVRGYEGKLYVHRLIGVYWRQGAWRYLTQADADSRPDRAVGRESILGRLSVVVGARWRCWAMMRFVRFCSRRCMAAEYL